MREGSATEGYEQEKVWSPESGVWSPRSRIVFCFCLQTSDSGLQTSHLLFVYTLEALYLSRQGNGL